MLRRSGTASAAMAVLAMAAVTGAGLHVNRSHMSMGNRASRRLLPFRAVGAEPGSFQSLSSPLRPRGSLDWRVAPGTGGGISGFTTATDGAPGSHVGLKVSTASQRFRVRAYRIGAYRGGTGLLVWRSRLIAGRVQPGPRFAPYRTRTDVAPWHRSLTIDTAGWPTGFYVLKLTTPSGDASQVPYVVSSSTTTDTVVLVVPVATWQAYNVWGGYSLYHGPPGQPPSFAVSFNRPYRGVGGLNDFRRTVVPVVVQAESSGVALSYLTDMDLQQHPRVLDGARGYVSVAHSEYWTVRMRSAVLRARRKGTNLAFLGANTEYWRIRLSRSAAGRGADRLETGYHYYATLDPERASHPSVATSRFRDQPDPRPENALVGESYECYPVTADYRVAEPGWWGFTGTGVVLGTSFPGLVGPEADRVYPDSASPHPLEVLSDSAYDCRGTPTTSQSVYYTTRSGAGVFSTGTLRWGCALANACDLPLNSATQDFVRRVTDTVFHVFARGPAGLRHPAQDNVDRFHLSTVNDVPAS
jgi:hypothetical protein